MAKSNLPNDEHTPVPAGVNAGPQSGAGGAGSEPKGAQLEHQAQGTQQPTQPPARHARPEHSSDTAQPGYHARPAGQSGLGEQPDRPSPLREPQGDGNYITTDHGDAPLRHG